MHRPKLISIHHHHYLLAQSFGRIYQNETQAEDSLHFLPYQHEIFKANKELCYCGSNPSDMLRRRHRPWARLNV